MWAGIATAVLKALGEAIVQKLADFINGWLTTRKNIAQGEAIQAAAETAQSAKTEEAIAQAEAQGPSSAAEAIERAKEGKL